MAIKVRDLVLPYKPSSPPVADDMNWPITGDLTRYIYEELEKISAAFDQVGVQLFLNEDVTENIDGTFDWIRIFTGVTPGWDLPGGWDVSAGEYLIPYRGPYQFNLSSVIDPFGVGNKNYYHALAIVVTGGADSPTVNARYERQAGGADDVPLECALNGILPLYRGDVIHFEWGGLHSQFTGTVDVEHFMQMARV